MWNIIAAIIGAITSVATGITGIILPPKNTVPVETFTYKACYYPQPDVKLTLKWDEDFRNVPDYRAELDPDYWGKSNPSLPETFNTADDCKVNALDGRNERTYIRVRQNARMSSCKVDEQAGPLATSRCDGWAFDPDNPIQIQNHRGTCSVDNYTDLRKIAQKDIENSTTSLEIFWNPFSAQLACNFDPSQPGYPNCGPGSREKINLKDFIYVLTHRDAFDQESNPNCPAQWDAGSQNEEACSHYFDIYIAEDLYEDMQRMETPDENDYTHPNYFLKQAVENCREETVFFPAGEADLNVPPIFIYRPFFAQNEAVNFTKGKIIHNGELSPTFENYRVFVWNRTVINPSTTSLIKKNVQMQGELTVCADESSSGKMSSLDLEQAENPNIQCYYLLGQIHFPDENGEIKSFNTYTKTEAPDTFVLQSQEDQTRVYPYIITEKTYSTSQLHSPSLQLGTMRLISQNQWTWATPWCKPAIYLYPENPMSVSVKLDIKGEITQSYPPYNPQGWQVYANPEGKLTSPEGADYPYLYYEADILDSSFPDKGFIFAKSDMEFNLRQLMSMLGFNGKETDDFLSYWLPLLQDKPFYFVGLLDSEEINAKEKLSVSPQPDSIIRARFVFEGLEYPLDIQKPEIKSIERTGFTLADWGGTIIGSSCSDFKIK